MVGMIASGPIGTIRGKIKVNGPWKPKKRVKNLSGPTWQE